MLPEAPWHAPACIVACYIHTKIDINEKRLGFCAVLLELPF